MAAAERTLLTHYEGVSRGAFTRTMRGMRGAWLLTLMLSSLTGGCATSGTRDKRCLSPSDVQYVHVSTNGSRTCAVRASGEVDCWGIDYTDKRDFVREEMRSVLRGVSDARKVDVGRGICVLRAPGADPVCFGDRQGPVESHVPVTQVATGRSTTCVLGRGQPFCWGKNNEGQLGIDARSPHEVTAPHPLALTDVVQLDLGSEHGCAVDAAGRAHCWGKGSRRTGRAGNDTFTPQPLPLTDVVQVAAGAEHSCAVLKQGSVRCWGQNAAGQLGSPGKSSHLPLEVPGIGDAIQVAAAYRESCALLSGGSVACWGGSRSADRGVRYIEMQDEATQITMGAQHACALSVGGIISCWGRGPRLSKSCRF